MTSEATVEVQNIGNTLMLQTVSSERQRIAKIAKADKEFCFRNLATRITKELLYRAYSEVRKDGAAGVDGQTAGEYSLNLKDNINDLHQRLKEQKYRAPKIRRAWIPKSGKEFRPLGIPTFEDKVVQRAVYLLLEPIYEEDFYEFSYGYRPGKKLHEAQEYIRKQCMFGGARYIIDADISGYFDNINHTQLREFLKKRVADGGIHRLIGKWLNAGVVDQQQVTYPEAGTPQGGVISPLLANIYLHYVLDEWFVKQVKPRMRGRVFVVRVADDFIIGCEYEQDAQRIMAVLPKRMSRYGLTLHATKTSLKDFGKPSPGKTKGKASFDFLGLRYYWGKSRTNKWVVKVKTSPKRLARTLKRINQWCKKNRHAPLKLQSEKLNAMLRGHYNYYGVTFNSRSLQLVYHRTEEIWHFWLSRRGDKRWTWANMVNVLKQLFPLLQPRIVHSYVNATQQLRFI